MSKVEKRAFFNANIAGALLQGNEMGIRKADPKLLEIHPLAHLIPDMRNSEWQDFYVDVAARGIRVA
ncbi:hypothetical protein M1N79_02670 [Dehalococcoidia bacterium]|nr:hypothetical protein [Dehalococcoidia bacterium]